MVQGLPGMPVSEDMSETDELRRRVQELREDVDLLRLAQDRLSNVSMLNAALAGRGGTQPTPLTNGRRREGGRLLSHPKRGKI